MKQILSLTLAIIMLIIALPTFAEGETGEYMGMTYTEKSGTIEITGYTSNLPVKAEIPPAIDNMPVTSIADGAFADSRLTEITIPKTVTHIGEGVFMGCKRSLLVHMEYNDSIHCINGMVYDSDGTVLFCEKNDTYTHAHDYPQFRRIGAGALAKYANNFSANLSNVKSVGEYAFMQSEIYSISFASLHEIEAHAFEDASFKQLYFGAVTSIGENAFTGAEGELYFCCDAPKIAENAFSDVKAVKIYYASCFKGWDKISIPNVELEEYTPNTIEVMFTQVLESAPTDRVLGTATVYNNLSLSDESIPEMPETEGYIIGGHALDDVYRQRTTDKENEVVCEFINYYLDITYTVTFKECILGSVVDVQNVKRSYDAVCPEAPVFECYDFEGWGNSTTAVMEDMEIYALYRIWDGYCHILYCDHYVLDETISMSDALIKQEMLKTGEKLTYPEPPQHDGYVFAGWSQTIEYAEYSSIIYANYKRSDCKVTFIDGIYNTVIDVQTVEYGKNAKMPTPPVHLGYTFTGWSDDGRNITEDKTIYALYEKTTHTYKTGDANTDGEVNTADAVYVLKFSANMINLSDTQKDCADTNKDGKVNTADAVLILKYAAGMISEF